MKMALTTPTPSNPTAIDRQISSSDNKSWSPNSSPRNSPRLSPKPQNRREDFKSDTHLTVNKDINSSQKQNGSPSSQEGSLTSRLSNVADVSSGLSELSKSESSGSTNKERKDVKGKKKSSWFNSFYPTYKSRSEDCKRIFKDVPNDERLIVDYSSALQKEILVHGRLYVTQNYLCFYANIFGWETTVTIKWKDVSSITKEKTALVIPNAVLICTKTEKMFFTSFTQRDKTYMMLFRVWQNALMDQPMTTQEMWQWVHQSYGDELGLTSDDEDYVAPGTEEDKLSARLSVDSFSEHEGSNPPDNLLDQVVLEEKDSTEMQHMSSLLERPPSTDGHIPTDMSDTTESDVEKPKCMSSNYKCTSLHEGRRLLNEIIPIHIDQLFTLLFTSSKFYLDFHASRKTTDLTQTPWTHNPANNSKSRVINLTVALSQALGPRTSQVTETQVMLPCSKAGQIYSIDTETNNAGIPYADSFFLLVHFCIRKISETQSSLEVYAQVKFRKSLWVFVKNMIEKNCWSGLEDFYASLYKALLTEGGDFVPDIKRKSRRKRRMHSMPRPGLEEPGLLLGSSGRTKSMSFGIFSSDAATLIVFSVLLMLVVLNIMLYYKLWSIEETPPYTLLDLSVLKNPPKSHDEWIKLLQKQETLHSVEIQKWQRILKSSIALLKQTETSLNELQRTIHPTYTNKIMSIIQNHKDDFSKDDNEEL